MLRVLLNELTRRIKRTASHESNDEINELRTAFIVRYREVLDRCLTLQHIIDISPSRLARKYMSHVMRIQKEKAWWHENLEYLTEPWFLYEYACDNCLVKQAERHERSKPALFPIKPETAEHDGYVRIRVERTIGQPACGKITIGYEQADELFYKTVNARKFECTSGKCEREIFEIDGGICDRAIETAIALLKHGYSVCVEETLLRDRILAEDYAAAHPYWVLEGSSVDKLELRYPRDKQLHQYVYRAGGRWNGKTVEISICNAHLLDDLIRLYGFRTTEGAKLRMDAWKETIDQATVYRPRKRKDTQDTPPMIDRFRELMDQKPRIIDDLYENDE